jgi:glycerol-3-phosphate dehydrogenase
VNGERTTAESNCDVLVVGGGINGAGIARDLAGRGLSVVLCERDDLAAHTSSASTKMIHGGIRYLEHHEFGMVRKSLQEREVLMKSAPHLIRPLRLVVPHDPHMRPLWLMRIGLFLYDHLARREVLPGSTTLRLRGSPLGAPLQPRLRKGFVYSDGWVDDARLVVMTALDAAERGTTVLTRCSCEDAQRSPTGWQTVLRHADGRTRRVYARALVNATGPWVAEFLGKHAHQREAHGLRRVKGSHIVVPKLFDHDHAYVLQGADRRLVFLIPYENEFTLIGTTDIEQSGPVGPAKIDAKEIDYLCALANRYLVKPISPADVVWHYSGVRPLLDDETGDPSAISRDYQLELDLHSAPLLNVWGGKLTTFRRLAEEAADLLAPALGAQRGAWTHDALLPGGDLRAWLGEPTRPDLDITRFERMLGQRYPELSPMLCRRLARAYGSRTERLLRDGLGAEIAPGLFEAELRHLHREEWAMTAEDVLWRRTKLGLHYTHEHLAAVQRWFDTQST